MFLRGPAQCVEPPGDDVDDGSVMLEGLRHHEADPCTRDDQKAELGCRTPRREARCRPHTGSAASDDGDHALDREEVWYAGQGGH